MTSSSDGPVKPPRAQLASQLDVMVADVEASTTTAFLVGLSGRHAGKLFRIQEGESILGRSTTALVTLDEKAVSQQHAQLIFRAGQCVLLDLGSTNGTYVNEVRVTQAVELHAGDVIRLGKTVLGFLTDADDQEQHTRALARVSTAGLALGHGRRLTSGPTLHDPRSVVLASGSAVATAQAEQPNPLDMMLDKGALLAAFLKSYWLGMVLAGAVGALVGATTVFVRPPRAMASFLIALQHQKDDGQQYGRFVAQGAEYFRHPEANFLSAELVSSTLASLKLPPQPALPYVASLNFNAVSPGIYRGEFLHAEARDAERFLAAHLQNYLEAEITKSIKLLSSEVALLRKQFQDNERNLHETEKKLKDFKEKNLAGLPENAVGQLGARATLQGRIVELQANLERYTQELAFARKQHAAGDAIVATRVERTLQHSTALATTRQTLAAARSRGLTDAHPEVQALLKQVRELEALEKSGVAAESTDVERRANREYTAQQGQIGQLEVLVSSTRTELGLVSGRLGEINKITATMPAVEAEFSELSRNLATSQNLHQHLYEQLKAKELKLEFDRASVAGRFEILEPLSAAPVDRAGTAMKRAGMGGGAGIALGVAGGILHLIVGYARRRKKNGTRVVLPG